MARTIDWQRTGGKTHRVTVTQESLLDVYDRFLAAVHLAQTNAVRFHANAAQAAAARYNLAVSFNGVGSPSASHALSWLGF